MSDSLSLTQNDITIESIIEALLNVEETFPPKYLYRLSDLHEKDIKAIKEVWYEIPDWRRRGLIEDTETMFERDYLLSYESLCRIGIEDENPQIRFLALRSLGGYEAPDLIPRIIDFMHNDVDPEVREIAAALLGKYVYMGEIDSLSQHKLDEIIEQLLDVYHSDEDAHIRQKALEALGYSSYEGISKLIRKAYQNAEPGWKASAINAMGKSYNKDFSRFVLKGLGSEFEIIRLEAIRAAGELEIAEAISQLVDNLEDSNLDIRLTSVWSLSQIGGNRAKKSIEALLNEDVTEEESSVINEALEYLEFNDSIDLDDFDEFDLFD